MERPISGKRPETGFLFASACSFFLGSCVESSPKLTGDAKLNAPRLADLLVDASVFRLHRSRQPGSSRESYILLNAARTCF